MSSTKHFEPADGTHARTFVAPSASSSTSLLMLRRVARIHTSMHETPRRASWASILLNAPSLLKSKVRFGGTMLTTPHCIRQEKCQVGAMQLQSAGQAPCWRSQSCPLAAPSAPCRSAPRSRLRRCHV